MDGFLSRLCSLILVFLMLIIAPLINAYGVSEVKDEIEILNISSEFLDKVVDKRSISQEDMDEFYLQLEAHGKVLDVDVQRLVKVSTLNPEQTEANTTYIAADSLDALNIRDIVKIKLKEKSVTPYKKLLNMFLKIDCNPYELELAKMVR